MLYTNIDYSPDYSDYVYKCGECTVSVHLYQTLYMFVIHKNRKAYAHKFLIVII
jgi:hypothetical protein